MAGKWEVSTEEALHWLPKTQWPEELWGERKHFQKGIGFLRPSQLYFSCYM